MAIKFFSKIGSDSKIAFDTMCFIYHFEANPTYKKVATAAFEEAFTKDLKLITSTITLTELSGYASFVGENPQPRLYRSLLENVPNLNLIEVNLDLAEMAGDLKGRYNLKSADAIQLAMAVREGAAVFLTNDKKLKKVKEVKVLLLSDFL